MARALDARAASAKCRHAAAIAKDGCFLRLLKMHEGMKSNRWDIFRSGGILARGDTRLFRRYIFIRRRLVAAFSGRQGAELALQEKKMLPFSIEADSHARFAAMPTTPATPITAAHAGLRPPRLLPRRLKAPDATRARDMLPLMSRDFRRQRAASVDDGDAMIITDI